jgi:hypothetical protein
MYRCLRFTLRLLAPAVLALLCAPLSTNAQNVAWTRQLGTVGSDQSRGVSADSLGNVFISGQTTGSLSGSNAGLEDSFVSKYDAAGNLLWTQQFGTSNSDIAYGVVADGVGNAYVTGFTYGSLGGPSTGGADAYVRKYDTSGNLLWTRQLGTSSVDSSVGVSADGLGNVYISGNTEGSLGGPNAGGRDAFVTKYDAAGVLKWTRQLGTSADDLSFGVSADHLGNVFISGYTDGSLGGPKAGGADAFVSKYDSAGALVWSRQLGTSNYDVSYGASADNLGNVYITGYTAGSLDRPNAGVDDAFLSKYDGGGNLLWTRQLGTTILDDSNGVAADSHGNVYISGYNAGSLGPDAAFSYPFISKYDSSGQLIWMQQLEGNGLDSSLAVSTDGMQHVYISGYTRSSLSVPYPGDFDAFVAKINDTSTSPTPVGDYNGDGNVDAGDYTIWRHRAGNVASYDFWRANFGQSISRAEGTMTGAAVPEPLALVLLLAAALGCAAIRARYAAGRATAESPGIDDQGIISAGTCI